MVLEEGDKAYFQQWNGVDESGMHDCLEDDGRLGSQIDEG